jgi:predicted DNA-binding protein
MGAKLTKSKSLSISEKTKEQQKEVTTTVENTNNHLDITTNEGNKQIKMNKNKKQKEPKLNKKSSETKEDKSTNTESCVLPSSSFTEQLVGDQLFAVDNNSSLETKTAQVNAAYQPEVPNKYVQELRDACLQNGMISTETHGDNQQTSNEHKNQTNNLNIVEEATNYASGTVVVNSDQVHNKEQ